MGKSREVTFIAGFTIGLAMGSAMGLLFAPARGLETRQELGSKTPQLGNRARAAAQGALAQSKGLASQSLTKLSATAGEAKAKMLRHTDGEA